MGTDFLLVILLGKVGKVGKKKKKILEINWLEIP